MGEGCRDCRKWEEDIYWNHFQCIHFCQFLSPGFDQQLAIPKKFSNNLKEKLPENISLKGPSGAKWNVGLITSGDTLLFKHGWKSFVEDHSLEEEDVLIFKYNGDSLFDVLIFDGRNLCEREASYFVRKCGHIEVDGRFQTKRNTRESSVNFMQDYSQYTLGYTPSKRPRKAANLMPVQSGQRTLANGRIREEPSHGRPQHAKWDMSSGEPSSQKANSDKLLVFQGAKRGLIGGYPVQYSSNRRLVTEEEREKALQMAHAASTKDSFIVVMRPSHVYKGFYMSIPSEWATSHLPRKSQGVTLRVVENACVKENTWHARFYNRVYGGGLTGGWKNFSVDNNLEEFDACLFELASVPDDTIVLDVTIFRVVEEISPLVRLNFPSSRSVRDSKRPRGK